MAGIRIMLLKRPISTVIIHLTTVTTFIITAIITEPRAHANPVCVR